METYLSTGRLEHDKQRPTNLHGIQRLSQLPGVPNSPFPHYNKGSIPTTTKGPRQQFKMQAEALTILI